MAISAINYSINTVQLSLYLINSLLKILNRIMCFTVANNKSTRDLQQRYNKKVSELKKAEHNKAVYLSGFAHPVMAIITAEEPDYFSFAKWGLVPGFVNQEEKAKEYSDYTLNAKSETIFEKISFKKVIEKKRCLIPVTGFYEWRELNKTKYPYFIHLKEEEIFSLGGVYDEWANEETGELTTTFSIITTEANPLMSKIHNVKKRMPLIFPKQTEEKWISDNLAKNEIEHLMQPLNEDLMEAYTIQKINPRKIDIFSEELTKLYSYPELFLLDE